MVPIPILGGEPESSHWSAADGCQGQQDSRQQEAGSLVWVQYQRFAKRTEGVRASRQVRGHADIDPCLPGCHIACASMVLRERVSGCASS